jgi:anti-sigma B factor antagonist
VLVLDVEERADGRVLVVSGDLDVATAPQVRSEALRLIGPDAPDLVIDLSRVDFIDSFGLGVLVGALKRANTAGQALHLVVTESRLLKVFEVTGLDRVFHLAGTVDEALDR